VPDPFRLLLVRHGQTHANVAGSLDTAHPGLDLTDLGRRQAGAAADALAAEPIEAIYVSSRVRTHQTAAPTAAARGLEPVTLEGLEEVSAGQHEMAADHDAIASYLHTVGSWIDGRHDVRMPGGESGHEFLGRYDAAIARIAAAGHRCAMVVSHGAAIRVWTSTQIDESVVPEAHSRLHNTACITLEGHPEAGWSLVSWHADPLGGHELEDADAPDPTGEPDD
jgi:broad specificity phosphatase PhoE